MMNKVKLKELINVKTGKLDANASSENGRYPFFTCSKIPLKIDSFSYDCECVLVAGNGDLNAKYYNGKFDAYQRTYILESLNKEKLNVKYLYYFMQKYLDVLRTQAIGGVIKYIKLNNINDAIINLYDLDSQNKIVDKLDKIQEIIDIRKKQIEELDVLIKARFVELFGDPVLNPKGWECKTVIDECDCMVPGRDKPKSFTGDIPWITIEDLAVNGVTYESKSGLGLTQEEIDEVNRKTIPRGSVIMSCVGNLGICSIAGKEMIINQQLHSFQCGERINNVFLMNYLGYRKDFMNNWASNTTVLYMNKSICNSIPVIIPPMELQEQFANFVEQTDKSKLELQKSLEKMQNLFDSLMAEYFG